MNIDVSPHIRAYLDAFPADRYGFARRRGGYLASLQHAGGGVKDVVPVAPRAPQTARDGPARERFGAGAAAAGVRTVRLFARLDFAKVTCYTGYNLINKKNRL